MNNERLKRLLDKKRRALQLPKAKLGALEDEYNELLQRIDEERYRLHIDEDRLKKYINSLREKFCDNDMQWYLKNNKKANSEIEKAENIILKSARSGDVSDCEYYKKQLYLQWMNLQEKSHKNQQLTLL